MRLNFIKRYKSITGAVARGEVSDFIVLSGPNGVGKSHLLEAIESGAITIDDVPSGPYGGNRRPGSRPNMPVRLFRINQLVVAQDQSSQSVSSYKNNWREIRVQVKNTIQGLANARADLLLGSDEYEQELVRQMIQGRILSSLELQEMIRCADKRLSEFSDDDFRRYSPVLVGIQDPFSFTVSQLFLSYAARCERNQYRRWREETGLAEGVASLTEEEFIERHGQPPWDLLNETMSLIGLEYHLNSPENAEDDEPFEVRLMNNETGAVVQMSELSSGEKVLMSIAMSLYMGSNHSGAIELPQVLLLDEPDASLHPSMIRSLLRVINDIFCEGHGVRVILVTHSPSTVALAPEESLYTMRRTGEPRIRKAPSRDHALKGLMVGLPTLSVRNENRRQVFVESKYDEGCYQGLFRILKDKLETPFSLEFIASGASKNDGNDVEVVRLVQRLQASGNQVQGVVDRDMRSGAPKGVHYMENRRTLENLVLDPLPVGFFLLREGIVGSEEIVGKSLRARDIGRSHSQAIIDYVVKKIRQNGDSEENVIVNYVGGFAALLPKFCLEINGHVLEGRYKDVFRELRSYPKDFKTAVIGLALADEPDFVPQDVVDLFRKLTN